jgi:glycosyltransferase involved in cell wall biosynthesis
VKILIVTFNFPPQVGGVAEVARTQAAGFAARRHDVTVATEFDPLRVTNHKDGPFAIRQFKITGSYLAGAGYRGELAEFQTFVATEPFDFILIHCWQNWGVDVAAAVFDRTRARKIMVTHGLTAHIWLRHSKFAWGLGQWLRGWPYMLRLPRLMKSFDRMVFLSAQSDFGRFFDYLMARRFCPERVAVIPNGVHLTKFSSAEAKFCEVYAIETKYLVLNVANYDDRKNQKATLRDFMAANRDDATMVFIGGEFNAYQAEVAQLHEQLRARFPRARVRFLEKIPKPMIYAAYQAADVFILSSKQETQPLAILDAMAAGIPFISTDTGCVREFPGGWVCDSGPTTTQALTQLLDDAGQRKQLGAAGRHACEITYDWERVLDAYEALFHQLIASEPASPGTPATKSRNNKSV